MSRVALSSKGLNSIPDLTIAPLETFPDETASVDENGEKFVQEDWETNFTGTLFIVF